MRIQLNEKQREKLGEYFFVRQIMDPRWIIPIVGFSIALVGLIIILLDRPQKTDKRV